jgi:glyoxylase-like metal-dependent hydrolase (beta-lactamase superfamily II)
VVVDTGVGNDRLRPYMPPLDHLNTGFLAALASAGIDRNSVDVVVNTHIHSDHVGWNTMGQNDTWVPTFPNARYVMPAADYHPFAPDGPAARETPRTEEEEDQQRGNQLVFADSVLPIDEACEAPAASTADNAEALEAEAAAVSAAAVSAAEAVIAAAQVRLLREHPELFT